MKEKKDGRALIMDAAGNFHLVKSQPFKKAKAIQIECVRFAAKSLLDRSTKGFDDKLGLEQVYLTKNCGDQIKKIVDQEQKEFELKNISQTCEVGSIKIIQQRKNYYIANIEGQLVRACKYMDHSYVDVRKFNLGLMLYKNPNMSTNGRFPLVVVQITKYKTKEKKGIEK
jgi:hypothetical protein